MGFSIFCFWVVESYELMVRVFGTALGFVYVRLLCFVWK